MFLWSSMYNNGMNGKKIGVVLLLFLLGAGSAFGACFLLNKKEPESANTTEAGRRESKSELVQAPIATSANMKILLAGTTFF